MPPFNYHEEPLQLFLSSDDGQIYEPFTELKDVTLEINDDSESHPDWVCCPYDCGFSATITLTNQSRRTIKKWDKAVKKYVNRLNRRKRLAKRIKEQLRRFAWKVCKGKPPKDFWERYWRREYGK
jgi:hypothetical protein